MIDSTQELDELLNDPMIGLMMASDGVQAHEVRLLLQRARDRGMEAEDAMPFFAGMIGESRCANWFCG
jgi:hypothetical protein